MHRDHQTMSVDSERLERIETRIAYLEHANAQLSDVALKQERDIEALRMRVADLLARLDAAKGADAPWSAQHERPPHY